MVNTLVKENNYQCNEYLGRKEHLNWVPPDFGFPNYSLWYVIGGVFPQNIKGNSWA